MNTWLLNQAQLVVGENKILMGSNVSYCGYKNLIFNVTLMIRTFKSMLMPKLKHPQMLLIAINNNIHFIFSDKKYISSNKVQL